MNQLDELRAQVEEARTRRDRLFTELDNARARADGSDGQEERIGNLNRAVEKADSEIADLEAQYGRSAYLDRLAGDTRNLESVDVRSDDRVSERVWRTPAATDVDRALRTVESYEGRMETGAADRIDRLVRRGDGNNIGARYVEAVGDPAYRSAFGKMLADMTTGHLRFSSEEVEAVRKVSQVDAERSMSIGSSAAGGYALPYVLDPSIIRSGSGALNPIRAISRVIETVTNTWKGVSSDGVTSSYVGEAATATDGSPTLAQPVVTCAQWRVFVPFSIEVGQDWPDLDQELVSLVADAQNVNDATQFYTGNGTLAPRGVMTDLTSTQVVHTSGNTLYAVGDPWALKAAIPARFTDTATFAAHPKIWDTTFRFVGGNSTEPYQFGNADRGGDFLGRPKVEWSAVGTQVTTSSSTIMVAGDWSKYTIVDRVGIQAELVPHLFSGNTAGGIGWPVGQRGLYCYGRTGAAVTATNAFRVLVVT